MVKNDKLEQESTVASIKSHRNHRKQDYQSEDSISLNSIPLGTQTETYSSMDSLVSKRVKARRENTNFSDVSKHADREEPQTISRSRRFNDSFESNDYIRNSATQSSATSAKSSFRNASSLTGSVSFHRKERSRSSEIAQPLYMPSTSSSLKDQSSSGHMRSQRMLASVLLCCKIIDFI